ncbi:MAG: hypothetical protein JW797_13255 [Bradymonadales bacterium]|nr:hypothetical protein [Bradymonadales bacterium]
MEPRPSPLPACRLPLGLAFAAVLLLTHPSRAAEVTDVVDAFDEAIEDPFDFHFEPTFRQTIQSGNVVRERNCTPDPTGDPRAFLNAVNCPDEAAIILTRELEYERVVNQLDLDFQFGIWHDLEFHVTLPIIFSDQRTVSFAKDDQGNSITQSNSSIDPLDASVQQDVIDGGFFTTYRLFEILGADGPTRAGLGDMVFGIAWAPFNTERHPHLATLKLGFDYLAPTSEVATRTNDAPGRGLHELQFTLAGSRRFRIVEPYVMFQYFLPLPTSDSLFVDYGGGQRSIGPGMRGEITSGTEFIVYENPRHGQLFTIDLGFQFGFTAEGQDHSPLFDALGGSPCNGITPAEAGYSLTGQPYQPSVTTNPDAAACAWLVQQPSAERRDPSLEPENRGYYHDGITSVESYATISGHLGANFQVSRYVEVRLMGQIGTETEHFITMAKTGVDRDNDDEVNFSDPNERNPVYNPTLDAVGNRLRVQSVLNFSWFGTLAFQF